MMLAKIRFNEKFSEMFKFKGSLLYFNLVVILIVFLSGCIENKNGIATGNFVIIDVPDDVYDANLVGSGGITITKGRQNSIGINCPSGFNLFGITKEQDSWNNMTNSFDVENDEAIARNTIFMEYVTWTSSSGVWESGSFKLPFDVAVKGGSNLSISANSSSLTFRCLGPNGAAWSV
jgi:hypothetical protein